MVGYYAIVFDNRVCMIKDKFGQPMVNVHIIENKMFALKISNMENKLLLLVRKMI